MIFRIEVNYDENVDIPDTKKIAASSTDYTLALSIYEFSGNNLMLKSLLPDEVTVNITIDDFRLISSLITIKAIRFTIKSFFFTILGFTQFHSVPPADYEGFVQLFPVLQKALPNNIIGIDKVHFTLIV